MQGIHPIAILEIREEPKPFDVILCVDYLLGQQLKYGISSMEADYSAQKNGIVFFELKQKEKEPIAIGAVPAKSFRQILARFSVVCGIPQYVGQGFFDIIHPHNDVPKEHYFSIFVCNEPTMDFWIRVYLYNIEQ